MRFVKMISVLTLVLGLCVVLSARAQDGECADGELCGTPDESGGGGGGGSILLQKSDLGDTYQYADDYDEDGVEDEYDNCPFVFNPMQLDADGDDTGTDCDVCVNIFDPDQDDTDWDNTGDACDEDLDGDGIINSEDNCLFTPNPERPQIDIDGDGLGAVCDSDDNGNDIVDAYEWVDSLDELLQKGDKREEIVPHTEDEVLPELDEKLNNTGCSM
jgi:hypothetical protein